MFPDFAAWKLSVTKWQKDRGQASRGGRSTPDSHGQGLRAPGRHPLPCQGVCVASCFRRGLLCFLAQEGPPGPLPISTRLLALLRANPPPTHPQSTVHPGPRTCVLSSFFAAAGSSLGQPWERGGGRPTPSSDSARVGGTELGWAEQAVLAASPPCNAPGRAWQPAGCGLSLAASQSHATPGRAHQPCARTRDSAPWPCRPHLPTLNCLLPSGRAA